MYVYICDTVKLLLLDYFSYINHECCFPQFCCPRPTRKTIKNIVGKAWTHLRNLYARKDFWVVMLVTASPFCHRQGQMVARGTYSELQGSGLDFTSLLQEEEGQEEERQGMTPIPVSRCPHTLSDNSMSSMSSLSSSRYSLIEGAEPLAVVGIFETTKTWAVSIHV